MSLQLGYLYQDVAPTKTELKYNIPAEYLNCSTCSIGLMISVMRNCVMSHNYFVTQLPCRINHKFCFYCSFQWDDKIVLGGKVHKTLFSEPSF